MSVSAESAESGTQLSNDTAFSLEDMGKVDPSVFTRDMTKLFRDGFRLPSRDQG